MNDGAFVIDVRCPECGAPRATYRGLTYAFYPQVYVTLCFWCEPCDHEWGVDAVVEA